jgi:2-oxoglutarate ferredoxin oxidoreductase subunit delta
MTFCPKAVITSHTKVNASGYVPASFNMSGNCTGCGICAIVCPEVAIEVYRE